MIESGRRRLNRRKTVWSGLAVLAVVTVLSGLIDDASQRYASEAFTRALVTFAVARTLNGVISVAQGTEVAIEPGGVGVNFSVGQVLDPINDLVERFSAVMLVATSSLGLQNVLLRMTMWWGTSLALVLVAAFALLVLWWRKLDDSRLRPVVMRLLLLTVFLRFAVPILVIGSNLVFDTFLAAEQAAATEALEATRTDIEQINENATTSASNTENQSVIERLGSMLDSSLESMNISDRLARLRDRVSNASEHIINLIVIFVLQTIILPLVFLWMFIELLKRLAAGAAFHR
jgi:ABC-type multidrug transport system fused ATPase/permease subunit